MNQYYGLQPGTITKEEREHSELVREIAARGMVLLENKGALPLETDSRVALYGYGARNTVTCGLGAASFQSRETVSIEEGLKRAGIEVTSGEYLDRYSEIIRAGEEAYYDRIRNVSGGSLLEGVMRMYSEPLVPKGQPIITKEDIRNAHTDTAVYVISRTAGEGADRKVEAGDYLLSDEETENLQILSENFTHLIVLLNVGDVMDTEVIRVLPNLGALLLVGQAGGVTGLAVADVLTGKIVPEGKLASTWARQYADYPSAETYAAMDGNLDDEFYKEGIYVGYRYFDSFEIEPVYPFGYGLSYTDFSMDVRGAGKEGDKIWIDVMVSNCGSRYAGRETVQIYVSAPQGDMEKPRQELKGFGKTEILEPGQGECVRIYLSARDLAFYSEQESAWVLEAGEYLVRTGNSSRNTHIGVVLSVPEEIVCEQCRRLFQKDCEFDEIRAEKWELSKQDREEVSKSIKIDILPKDVETIFHTYTEEEEGAAEISRYSERYPVYEDGQGRLTFRDVCSGAVSLDRFVDSLTAEELAYLCVGNFNGEESASIVCAGGGSEQKAYPINLVPGSCDTTRELIDSRGIPNIHCADGGSGVRILPEYELDQEGNLLTDGLYSVRGVSRILGRDYIMGREHNKVYEQYTTGLPIATLLAQTWDRELCRKCGEIEGREMQRFHVELWLAPSMNIHRNPLCGRNFEYYSEDPYITGECAAAVTQGLQSFRRVGVTLKHFACNNQEDNRHATNVHISERTIREIYLRGFAMCARKAHPEAVMSSYNLINGIHSANHRDLLTAVLRDEWGFEGIVMTDWGTTSQSGNGEHKYKASTCAGCIQAGNDLIMPGSGEDYKNLLDSVQNGEVSPGKIRLCAKRILRMMLRLYK